MDKTTNMNDFIQSMNSFLLQPQVTKLQQEQPCDFVVPQRQVLWTMTQSILAGMATSYVLVSSSFVNNDNNDDHHHHQYQPPQPAPAINPYKSGRFCTILPLLKYEHILAPRACSILLNMKK